MSEWTVRPQQGRFLLEHQFGDVLEIVFSFPEYESQMGNVAPMSLLGTVFYYRDSPYRLLDVSVERGGWTAPDGRIWFKLFSPGAVAREWNLSFNEYAARFGHDEAVLAFGEQP